jgi:signal transduction histidine kinase/RimJ/RimL family protein N-acetyltransferase
VVSAADGTTPRRPPDPPLADEAVLLRLPGEADVDAIATACADPGIARWIPVPVPYLPSDARTFIAEMADGWTDGTEIAFAIEERATGSLAGMIGLHPGATRDRASVGYWLAPAARGRGLATRAVRLVAAWAFEDPAIVRLELMTLVGNDASGRVALRAGFRREGILRRYLPFRDRSVDAVMYSMVRDEGPGDVALPSDDPLGRVSLFAGLAPGELARIRAVATEAAVAAGTAVMTEGEPGDALYVVLEGDLAVTKRAGATEVQLTIVGPGSVQGEIAVLEGGVRRATVRAVTPARLLRIGRDDLFDVMAREPAIIRSLASTVAGRLRILEASVQEQERLASLGTLAAGLAHELNNPAAAARSSAGRLLEALDDWDRASAALAGPAGPVEAAGPRASTAGHPGGTGSPAASPLVAELLDALREEVARRAADPPRLDPLDALDRRDAVATLLGRLGVADPVEPAASLVALGWDGNELDDLLAPFATDEVRLVVASWLAASALVRQLLSEVVLAAGRISEIVAAVREYTYLDRAPVQRVDVTIGIENTLVILRAKWKAGVAIRRDYAPELPPIEAYGSELNQVWTNLIDNALDAMGRAGDLAIAAHPASDREGVVVEICDSGPGIPDAARAHVFDPFFTTKEVGAGTGLGLYISRSIVERHGGRLEIASTGPAGTCFRVSLRTRLPAAAPSAGATPVASEDGPTTAG